MKKTLKLNLAKRRATTVEVTREVAEELQGKLNKTEVKLAEVSSLVTTREKELANLKEVMNNYEQIYYNMGFKDVENSAGVVIVQAHKLRFSKGWMVAVNVVNVLEDSSLRDASQIPLSKDLLTDAQEEEHSKDVEEEEGKDSLGMREFSKQIDAHVVVLDKENQNTAAPIEAKNTLPLDLSFVPSNTTATPETSAADPQNPSN